MQKLELVLGFDQVVKLKGKTLRKRISSKIEICRNSSRMPLFVIRSRIKLCIICSRMSLSVISSRKFVDLVLVLRTF